MRTSDMIQSKYIRKEDLRQAPMVLTVANCTQETVGTDTKWVLWFSDHPKGLGLNNTKIRLLEAAYGDDSDYWVGKRVRLSFDPSVLMAGQVVGGIKLQCSTQPAPAGGVYPGNPQYSASPPAAQAPAHLGPGAPPAPVWNGTQWVLPAAAPPPDPQAATWGGAPTMSQRMTPPAGQAPAAAPEFDDDIPF